MAGYSSTTKNDNHVPNLDGKYRALYEIFPGLICILDEKGIITDVNKRMLEFFGYEKEEVMGKPCLDFVSNSHKKNATDALGEMVCTGVGPLVELVLVRKDKTKFFGLCRGTKITKTQYLVTIEDVSALYLALDYANENTEAIKVQYEGMKRANQLLRQSESKYQDLYESSPDLLRTIDLSENIVNCNMTYVESLGYVKEEIIGKSVFDHTAEKSHDSLRDSIEEWRNTGKIVNREIWMKRKDGTEFPTLLSGTSLYDVNGNVMGRTVSLRDITNIYESKRSLEEKDRELEQKYRELKDAHLLLVDAEEKYRLLYDYSPLLYRTIDMSGIIRDCNKSYAESLGYAKEEILGKSIFDHVAENSHDDLLSTFHTWKTEGEATEKLIWLKRKDGTIFPTILSATSLYNKKGELLGSSTIIKDITETFSARQQAEQERIKRLSAMGELTARIAHDMRNPMATIKSAISLIRLQNGAMDEGTLNKLALIDGAIARMSHQIDEVLDFVAPKPPMLIRANLSNVLEDTVKRMSVPSTVRIILPQKSVEVLCDPYKIEIVLVNLITNAMQAMEDKGTITIGLAEDVDTVHISVADTGTGMPVELVSKIFDPLFTTRMVGTGLGLTSCKNIIEKHGGTINVKTAVGKGTTFTMILPKKSGPEGPKLDKKQIL